MYEKNKNNSCISLLIIAVMVLTNPLLVLADALHVDTIQIEGSRLGENELIEGNLVYFGTTNVSVREGDAIYRVPVYRAGDLS
ncbi:MAG: hypothetical protein MJ059_01415 [Lachnospiraceae bacterium]|nr:hypothetical protein [Lachnospiraceae bacterium]